MAVALLCNRKKVGLLHQYLLVKDFYSSKVIQYILRYSLGSLVFLNTYLSKSVFGLMLVSKKKILVSIYEKNKVIQIGFKMTSTIFHSFLTKIKITIKTNLSSMFLDKILRNLLVIYVLERLPLELIQP